MDYSETTSLELIERAAAIIFGTPAGQNHRLSMRNMLRAAGAAGDEGEVAVLNAIRETVSLRFGLYAIFFAWPTPEERELDQEIQSIKKEINRRCLAQGLGD